MAKTIENPYFKYLHYLLELSNQIVKAITSTGLYNFSYNLEIPKLIPTP